MDGYIGAYERCQAWKRQFKEMLRTKSDEGLGVMAHESVSVTILFKRKLEDHTSGLGVKLSDEIERMLKCTRIVTIAEIGCGRGDALLDAKQLYGPRVRTIGFDLLRIPMHSTIDEFVEMDFEEEQIPAHLDSRAHIVFSNYVFRYFHDPLAIAFPNVQKLLFPRGVAYIDLFSTKILHNPDMNAQRTLKMTKISPLPTYC